MANVVAVEHPAETQNFTPAAELPLETLALVGGGDGAVVPF